MSNALVSVPSLDVHELGVVPELMRDNRHPLGQHMAIIVNAPRPGLRTLEDVRAARGRRAMTDERVQEGSARRGEEIVSDDRRASPGAPRQGFPRVRQRPPRRGGRIR